MCVRRITGFQLFIVKQCKSGFPVENTLGVKNRNPCVIQMCCKQAHTAVPLVRLHMADQLVIRIIFTIKHETFLQQLQLVNEKHQKNTD